MKRYAEAFTLPGWQAVQPFALPTDADDLARFEETRAACIDFCGPDSFEIRLLDRGITTSHGQMPQRLRRLMTDLLERGICPVTPAPATLTAGVNPQFDFLFLPSLARRTYDPQTVPPRVCPQGPA